MVSINANKRLLALLAAPFLGFSITQAGANESVAIVSEAIFSGVDNCRTRSQLITEVVTARESGVPLDRLLAVAGDDRTLHRLVQNAYESDRPAREQENAFYDACIDDIKRQIEQM